MSGSDQQQPANPVPEAPEAPQANLRDMRVAALKYNSETDPAPIVVAAGGGYVAQKIVEIADECGITVYHDDSAATLLSELNLGQAIPSELYQMVVDIYLAILKTADSTREDLQPLGSE